MKQEKKGKDTRVSIPVPDTFRQLAMIEVRSITNLAQLAFNEYVQRHGGAELNKAQNGKAAKR